jgi:anti-anti-sigma regulatory factor
MRIANVVPTGTGAMVVVTGRVTVDSSPELRAVLRNEIGTGLGITIDFSEASYLDTSAVATLLEAATLASERRVSLQRDRPARRRQSGRGDRGTRSHLCGTGYEVQFA